MHVCPDSVNLCLQNVTEMYPFEKVVHTEHQMYLLVTSISCSIILFYISILYLGIIFSTIDFKAHQIQVVLSFY